MDLRWTTPPSHVTEVVHALAFVEISDERNEDHEFWLVFSSDGRQKASLHCLKPYTGTQHFTLFWRGDTQRQTLHQRILHQFIEESAQESELLSVLLFFESWRERIQPQGLSRQPPRIPLSAETVVVEKYGDPLFLRYEVYPANVLPALDIDALPVDMDTLPPVDIDTLPNVLRKSRYTLWDAALGTWDEIQDLPTKNEVGIYTTLAGLVKLERNVAQLMCDTVPDLEGDTANRILANAVTAMRERAASHG